MITITLPKTKALVLHDWFFRMDEENRIPCDYRSEEIVLHGIMGQLENALAEPLMRNYDKLVSEARRDVEATG